MSLLDQMVDLVDVDVMDVWKLMCLLREYSVYP